MFLQGKLLVVSSTAPQQAVPASSLQIQSQPIPQLQAVLGVLMENNGFTVAEQMDTVDTTPAQVGSSSWLVVGTLGLSSQAQLLMGLLLPQQVEQLI